MIRKKRINGFSTCAAALLALVCALYFGAATATADNISSNPIIFVTSVPNPADFGTLAATFGNHVASPTQAYRGGDLWIRFPDGTLKNLTQAAGYGNTGFQGAGGIAVRDPAVHWDGNKVLFSMVVGAPTAQYQLTDHRWQLYEMTGLGAADTPVVTKVPNQPSTFNNVAPVYASDDTIIFVSDRPRDDSVLHTYPQRDEYESSPINSGLWKLNPNTGALRILDHSPSGDFNPIIDSFGRVVFSRWDHLQRDQQNVGVDFGAFNFGSEASTTPLSSAAEVFPEARSVLDPDKEAHVNLFTINQFFPWMMNQDGTDLETLNHVGRQEIGGYIERSFNNDSNVQEFYGQYSTGANSNEFTIFLHIKEDPTEAGTYFGTSCPEFGTHSAGQIVSLTGAPGLNPNSMQVTYLTHPDTSGPDDTPSVNHSGLYRDPLPLSNGKLIAAHATTTQADTNIGSGSNPLSRYAFRLRLLTQSGQYFAADTQLTSNITKSVSFWSPDQLISYNGPLWEMMPVEVKSRTRPTATTLEVPEIEQGIITGLDADLEELKAYLVEQNLALVISRNLTTRDKNDRQQPTNLRVTGTTTESIPHSGKVYHISRMEFFQGDLVRGYDGHGPGRRVLAQRMHSVESGVNPPIAGAAVGSTVIAEDGSMAAFVPASKALTWQMVDADGEPVVRERYWVTFQPGEIRVCASCHGVNTVDHLGSGAPTNPPLALTRLISHWKGLPPASTPTPVPSSYSLKVKGLPSLRARNRFSVTGGGKSSDILKLRVAVNNYTCGSMKSFSRSGTKRALYGKFPAIGGAKLKFTLRTAASSTDHATARVTLPKTATKSRTSNRVACTEILRSLSTRK